MISHTICTCHEHIYQYTFSSNILYNKSNRKIINRLNKLREKKQRNKQLKYTKDVK